MGEREIYVPDGLSRLTWPMLHAAYSNEPSEYAHRMMNRYHVPFAYLEAYTKQIVFPKQEAGR